MLESSNIFAANTLAQKTPGCKIVLARFLDLGESSDNNCSFKMLKHAKIFFDPGIFGTNYKIGLKTSFFVCYLEKSSRGSIKDQFIDKTPPNMIFTNFNQKPD